MNFSADICKQLCTVGLATSPDALFMRNFAFRGPVNIQPRTRFIRSSIDCFSYIGEYTSCCTSKIGRYCSIASDVSMGLGQHDGSEFSTSKAFCTSQLFDFAGYHSDRLTPMMQAKKEEETSNVTIGNDVWIGTHVIFPSDVKVGHGAIIGSGAIITKDVPPYAVVVGNNRIIKQRFSDEVVADMLEINWWDYNLPEMIKRGLQLPYSDPKAFIETFKQLEPKDLIEISKKWYYIDLEQVTSNQVKLNIIKEPFALYYDPRAPQEELQLFEEQQEDQTAKAEAEIKNEKAK